ncbi:antiviral reverse transcriptase Drt3a [Pseudoalteromonas tetraodonis]|uniref:antiviral reverse transcriptase Drt3a n=1 Tax=Pseudoalteromonas tetraodonis TaxID=43659 RepID=UPI003CFEA482
MYFTYEEQIKNIIFSDSKNRGTLEEKYFPRLLLLKKRKKILRKYFKELNIHAVRDDDYEQKKARILSLLTKINESIVSFINLQSVDISRKIIQDNYTPTLSKLDHKIKGKPIFTTKIKVVDSFIETIESDFIQRISKSEINYAFEVSASDRDKTISSLIPLLDDQSPKCIYRTDIKNFYESVPHDNLLTFINSSKKLTQSTKNLINSILTQYSRITGLNKGLPRGVPISATLAELYMKKVDIKIMALDCVNFYARYVDDIFIIIKTRKSDCESYKREIESVEKIIKDHCLNNNKEKTDSTFFDKTRSNFKFDFLGYNFIFKNKSLEIKLSDKKFEKYQSRINKIFYNYLKNRDENEGIATQFLINQIKYITSNVQLMNRKSNVFSGVYYSNKFITDCSQLESLDSYLHSKAELYCKEKYSFKIKKLSFLYGYENLVFRNYKPSELYNITRNL